MRNRRIAVTLAMTALLGSAGPGRACSLCEGRVEMTPTMRQEASGPLARVIVFGVIQKSTLGPDGRGVSEVSVADVVRDDPVLRGKKVFEVPRYLPVSDPRDPPRYLVFCDVKKGELDPYRGVPVKSAAAVDYLKKALALTDGDPASNLTFFFNYLDSTDPEVARDAFLEFARTKDRDVLRAGPKLDGAKLRGWIRNPKTPASQASLFATLLGAGGRDGDALFLRDRLDAKTDRAIEMSDGLLAGYLQLRPREGWELLLEILRDKDRVLTVRLAAVRTVRFLHGANPKENRERVLKAMDTILSLDDLADLAVEDLRRWEEWELTPAVLALYGKKGYDAPIMQQAVLRYALSCRPTPESRAFVARLRAADAERVREAEEALKFEKGG